MTILDVDSPALTALARDISYGRRLVAWVGSGLSRPAGLPSWTQLKTKLEARLGTILHRQHPELLSEDIRRQVNTIARLPDYWQAFSIKSRLPTTEYTTFIRNALETRGHESVPLGYQRIWKNPNVNGVISLNIDDFAQRGFSAVDHGKR